MKKQETFFQLIDRLADFNGLDWMRQDGTCSNKEMAIADVREHLGRCQNGGEWYLAGCARAALEELDKFVVPYYSCDVDWGEAKSITVLYQGTETNVQEWQPTEKDYLECCGVWSVCHGAAIWKYNTEDLRYFPDMEAFDKLHKDDVRIEPMPEQCIPKLVKKERYNVPFPLLRSEE